MTKDAKLEAGVDTLRDPFTGEVFEIEKIWLPEHISASPYMRGSGSETSALYGGAPRREQAKKPISKVCQSHRGPKEAA